MIVNINDQSSISLNKKNECLFTEEMQCIDLSKKQQLLHDKDNIVDMIDVSLTGYGNLDFDSSNSKITKN